MPHFPFQNKGIGLLCESPNPNYSHFSLFLCPQRICIIKIVLKVQYRQRSLPPGVWKAGREGGWIIFPYTFLACHRSLAPSPHCHCQKSFLWSSCFQWALVPSVAGKVTLITKFLGLCTHTSEISE